MYWNGTLSSQGLDVQISNGTNLNDMYVMALETVSTPDQFVKSSNLGSLSKSSATNRNITFDD